jgi:hypothetical protein
LQGADGNETSQRAEYASVQAISAAELAQHVVIDRLFLYREPAECEAQPVPEQGYIPRRKIRICGDATAFNPPDGPLVCYLYNPFGSLIVQRVIDRLEESHKVAPRPIFIVYVNPVHSEVIAANTCFQVVEQNRDRDQLPR